MHISIGTLSKIYKLSKEALRFYEKEGILEAERYENGYRYYTMADAKKLGAFKRLKNMGFSLNGSKEFFIGMDKDELFQAYEERCLEIEREIRDKSNVLEKIRCDIEKIPRDDSGLYDFKEGICKRYASSKRNLIADFNAYKSFAVELSQWASNTLFTSCIMELKWSEGKFDHSKIRQGFAIENELAEKVGFVMPAEVGYIEEQKCLTCISKTDSVPENFEELEIKLADYLERTGTEIKGEIYSISIMTYAEKNQNRVLYSEIIIPISKCQE